MERCPLCGGKLVHDAERSRGGFIGVRDKESGWRCENAFGTYKRPDPPCNYWIKDNGQKPDYEEACLRAESRKDIRRLTVKRDIDALFE